MATEDNDRQPVTPSQHHHMRIRWHTFAKADGPITQASLAERAAIVGRVGFMMLGCGTGAWRVRAAMDTLARQLGLTCAADVGLTSLAFTCFEHGHHYSQTLSLPASGVNTDKLARLEQFVDDFGQDWLDQPSHAIHTQLDVIAAMRGNFSAFQAGLASGLACAAFIFLLGGGWIEMLCCFFGAGVGNYLRRLMGARKITVIASTAISVAAACIVYLLVFKLLSLMMPVAKAHEAGYIGAMLFVIPGFPFITSGLDIAKQDMRSGLERGTFAIMVILVATLTGWVVAMLVHLQPQNFLPLTLAPGVKVGLWLLASWCGVFGFSIMFNSPLKMAAAAAMIGAIANTLRLVLAGAGMPAAAAAFLGALVAGLLASPLNKRLRYPRISLTVPAIVIMVPGLYMYRAMFELGLDSLGVGASWMVRAMMMVIALPLGLAAARIVTDKNWRHIG